MASRTKFNKIRYIITLFAIRKWNNVVYFKMLSATDKRTDFLSEILADE